MLVFGGQGSCGLGSHRTVTIGETVLDCLEVVLDYHSWHCIDCRLKHTPSLYVKETYLLVQDLGSEGQASGLAHI